MKRKESRAEEMGWGMGWEYSVESLGESKGVESLSSRRSRKSIEPKA
jgi:hypothetical protein